MVLIAAGLGAASCLAGAGLSALQPDLPAGAIIVTTAAVAFALSLIAGPAHGLLVRGWAAWRLNQSVARQHLLRAFYESWEDRGSPGGDQAPQEATWAELLADRSWTAGALRRHLAWALRQGLVEAAGEERYRLTASGRAEAHRLVRNHRLWELYLITFAEVATSRVDRDADRIEHVLEPALVSQLEARLREQYPHLAMPLSPHPHLHPEAVR
jgi:manganese/zinc/iron transport system permease protein